VPKGQGPVKDYAEDGVLVLVGGPLRFDDHAQRAVALAESIVRRWQDGSQPLDVGVGVAAGRVTVGIMGGAGRLEYAAVGSAANLASRLCEEAAPGEVLVADRRQTMSGPGSRATSGLYRFLRWPGSIRRVRSGDEAQTHGPRMAGPRRCRRTPGHGP